MPLAGVGAALRLGMRFSPKQLRSFEHMVSPYSTFLGVGSAGSGKTASCSVAMALAAAEHDGDHCLLGRTQSVAMRNVVRAQPLGILTGLKADGYDARVSSVDGKHVSIDGGRSKIWIYGGDNASTIDRIAGSTFGVCLVDELTRIHAVEDVWAMLWTRFRHASIKKLWCTMNPKGRQHWVKRNIIDTPDKFNAIVHQFDMDDNPSLTDEMKAGIAAGLAGHNYLRLIKGEWADAAGAIYTHVPLGKLPQRVAYWSIGFDWAASGVLAAVLIAHCAETMRMHVAGERYYNHALKGALTEIEQVKRTVAWARRWTRQPVVVYGDPSAPAALAHLFAQRGYVWQNADNAVLEGIQSVASAFQEGFLTVDPTCTDLLDEISQYIWDEKASAKGEDKPVKKNDHGCDALRYVVHTPPPIATARRFGP